jgi:peptidoglycan/LPS O-acetylase OafA/YrhL
MSSVLLPLIDHPTTDPASSTDRVPHARRFRPDIQGLRALAVVAIVLSDAKLGLRQANAAFDVFFAVSGFLITRQMLGNAFRLRAFPTLYGRRLQRLLPPGALAVVATFAGVEILDPASWPTAERWVAVLAQGAELYLAWPLVMALVLLLPRRTRGIALTAGATACFGWFATTSAHATLALHGCDLLVGALVALALPRVAAISAPLGEILGAAGLFIVLASFFAHPAPQVSALLPAGGTALVIVAGTTRARRIERILGEAFTQCLARVSLSWYLWHWPLLVLAPSVVGQPLGPAGRGVVVWLSLVVAVGSYFTLEAPLRRRATGGASAC